MVIKAMRFVKNMCANVGLESCLLCWTFKNWFRPEIIFFIFSTAKISLPIFYWCWRGQIIKYLGNAFLSCKPNILFEFIDFIGGIIEDFVFTMAWLIIVNTSQHRTSVNSLLIRFLFPISLCVFARNFIYWCSLVFFKTDLLIDFSNYGLLTINNIMGKGLKFHCNMGFY